MNIGDRIQMLRAKNNLSQEALADKLGISRQSISKWELGQSLPETENILQLSKLFGTTTDWLLLNHGPMYQKPNQQSLRFGMYLIVKDFAKSVDFYERLLNMRASVMGTGRFAQFFFDGIALSIMCEAHLPGHDYSGCGDHKFALNFYAADLHAEYERVKIFAPVTAIKRPQANYYFFNIYDPDGNVVEITGKMKEIN